MHDVIIIGGGIAGLSAAIYAKKAGLDFLLLESRDSLGGLIHSVKTDDGLYELGPNSIRPGDRINSILEDVGIDPIYASIPNKPLIYYKDGLKSPSELIDMRNGFQLLYYLFKSNECHDDISVKDFFCQYIGVDLYTKFITPLITGIYASNPSELSLKAVWPILFDEVSKKKSLIRLFLTKIFNKKVKREIINFPNGLDEFIQHIVDYIGADSIILDRQAGDIKESNNIYSFLANNELYTAKNIILATPSYVTARILPAAEQLSQIQYSPMINACVRISKSSLTVKSREIIDSNIGFLKSSVSDINILGVFHSSTIFEGRVDSQSNLLNVFLGGSQNPEYMQYSVEQIQEIVLQDLNYIYGFGLDVEFLAMKYWQNAVPQYRVGHLNLIDSVRKLLPSSVQLAGNYLEGVSIEDAAQSGYQAIQNILEK